MQHVHGLLAQSNTMLADGGQGWVAVGCQFQVVKADHGAVSRHAAACLAESAQGSNSHQVIEAKDGRRRLRQRQQLLCRPLPTGQRPIAVDDQLSFEGYGMLRQNGLVAYETIEIRLVAATVGSVGNPAMSQLDQVLDSLAGTCQIVCRN
jgi:hypothetical protein